MIRLSSPSPSPIESMTLTEGALGASDAGGCDAAWLDGGPDVGDGDAPGPHAAAMSASIAIAPPSLLWNIAPPLSPCPGVTPGRGACAVASRPAARDAPARPAPPWTMCAGSAA